MYVRLISLLFVTAVFASVTGGCADIVNIPQNTTIPEVYGKVVDQLGKAGIPNLIVKIRDKTEITNYAGEFIFTKVSAPYDIAITDTNFYNGYRNNIRHLYKSLSSSSLRISFPANYQTDNTAVISVIIDSVFENFNSKKFSLFFTDGNEVNGFGSNIDGPLGICNIFTPHNNSINGKIIVLIYTLDANLNIISYDNFGYKDVTIQTGSNIALHFSPADLNFNPPEAVVSGQVMNIPSSAVYFPVYAYISFSHRSSSGYLSDKALKIFDTPNINIVIPSDLPIKFYPVLSVNLSDSVNSVLKNKANFILPKYSISGLQFRFPPEVTLLSPQNNAVNFDINDQIIYDCVESSIIARLEFFNAGDSLNYTVFTASNTFRLSDLSQFGGVSLSGKKFYWSCSSIGNEGTVNSYLSPYIDNLTSNIRRSKTTYSFTTK